MHLVLTRLPSKYAEVLRDIFTQVLAGSKLLALHKNRFWQKPDGLHLDLGPFVAAIEYEPIAKLVSSDRLPHVGPFPGWNFGPWEYVARQNPGCC